MRALLSSLKLPTFTPELLTGYTDLPGETAPAFEAKGFETKSLHTQSARIEAIRALMLSELGEYGEKKFPSIVYRVRHCADIQGLWYARADLMSILANNRGQAVAREKLTHISSHFIGLLPRSVTDKATSKIR